MKKRVKLFFGATLLTFLIGVTPLNAQAHSLDLNRMNFNIFNRFIVGTQVPFKNLIKEKAAKENIKEDEFEALLDKRQMNNPDFSLNDTDNKKEVIIDVKEKKETILIEMPSEILEVDGSLKIIGLTEAQKVFIIVEAKKESELIVRRQLTIETLNNDKINKQLFWIFSQKDAFYDKKITFDTEWQGQIIAPDARIIQPKAVSTPENEKEIITPVLNNINPILPVSQKDPTIDGEIAASAESTVGHSEGTNIEKPDAKEDFEGILTIEVAEEGKPTVKIKDAIFSLYDNNDKLLSNTLRTDAYGKTTLKNIKKGSYYVQQTKTANQYELPKNLKQSFSISGKIENEKIDLVFENKKKKASIIDNTSKGTLLIIKEDDNNNKIRLAGAAFSIFQDNGVAIAQNLATNSKGEVTFNDLKEGNYYLKETNAPTGYEINNNRFNFTIKKDQQTKVVVKGHKIPSQNNQNNNNQNNNSNHNS